MSKSLIFIADISGFTRFVNETEISHSRHIVSELLEALIDVDKLGMEVAEIEGDAILFYKYGSVPTPADLVMQSEVMFKEFHSHLLNYKYRRICNCGACSTAHDLSLKFIAHAGDFNFLKVKHSRKPHGADVVLAHRLLKNDIPGKEYLLLTSGFKDQMQQEDTFKDFPWVKLEQTNSTYESIGNVCYTYTSLIPLREEIEVKPALYPDLTRDPIIVEGIVKLERKLLFELISNFDFRDQWNNEPIRLEYEQERVNRMGTRHVCVFDGKNLEFETVTNDFGPDKLVYGERLQDFNFIKEATNYFILEDRGGHTWLRIEAHLKPKSQIIRLISPFYKLIFQKNIRKVFSNIKGAAKTFIARGLADKKVPNLA